MRTAAVGAKQPWMSVRLAHDRSQRGDGAGWWPSVVVWPRDAFVADQRCCCADG